MTFQESRSSAELPVPAVSVVIPAYKAAAHITQALESVFAQTFEDYEVLVVNDGSPDTADLERVLHPHRERIVYLHQRNGGPGSARNAGIRRARAEYVAFLDSDDRWAPAFLAEQCRLLRSDPSLALVYADAWLVGATPLAGSTFMQHCPSRGEATFESLARGDCAVITSCVVTRRQALMDAGLFEEGRFFSEDFDLWLRMSYRGERIGYQTTVLAEHCAHPGSLTYGSTGLLTGQIEVCEKLRRELDLSSDQQQALAERRAEAQALLNLEQAKRSLQDRDYRDARKSVRAAQRFFRTRKLRLVLLGLTFSPGLLRFFTRLRDGRAGVRTTSAPNSGRLNDLFQP